MSALRAVVTDIEGTTSAVRFVHDVLFPYAAARLPSWVEARAGEPEVARRLEEARSMAGLPRGAPQGDVVAALSAWIAEDRKATPLKALQGLIWADGYRSGAFRSHVYPEVPGALARWRAGGAALYVYSSGSVGAQRLFFGHTEAGDLLPLFSGFFDTETAGPKRESASYRKILAALGRDGREVLFLSDVVAELDAAAAAGMATALVARDGPVAAGGHRVVTSFDEVG